MGMPPVDAAYELIENYLDANFHVSLNTPNLFLTVHAKTEGLKAGFDKIKTLECPQGQESVTCCGAKCCWGKDINQELDIIKNYNHFLENIYF